MAATLWLCWLAASATFAQEVPGDDPLVHDRRLSEWTRLLGDESAAVRRSTVKTLGRIGPQARAAVPALIEALQDPDSFTVRGYAAEALRRIGPDAKSAVAALIEALQDKSVHVRSQAAYALAHVGPEASAALPELKKMLDKDLQWKHRFANSKVCTGVWAAYAIAQLDPDDEVGLTFLVEALDKYADHDDRRQFITALGRIGPRARAALPALRRILDDHDQRYLRETAAFAIARIDPADERAFAVLLESLELRNASRRDRAARMLGLMGPEAAAAVPALSRALDDVTRLGRFRVGIFDALGEIGSADALPTLRLWLNDLEPFNREAAALAIYKIEKP